MTVKLLISEEQVKELTGINEAVDVRLLRPYIKTSQEMRIQPILGTDLYNKILTDRDTLTGAYATLYTTHVQPTLSWYAVVDALPTIYKRVGNGGVFQNSPQNATVVSDSQFNITYQDYLGKAEFYAQRMSDYLINNSSSFAELYTAEGDDIISRQAQPFYGIGLENYNPKYFIKK